MHINHSRFKKVNCKTKKNNEKKKKRLKLKKITKRKRKGPLSKTQKISPFLKISNSNASSNRRLHVSSREVCVRVGERKREKEPQMLLQYC